MPITFDEIAKVDNGARFYTGDLHIHSFGASADVNDSSLTPEAIVDLAFHNQLSVICLTDHNTDKHTQTSIDYAQRYAGQILVLAGVEVTTAHGHLLAYFAPEKTQSVRTLLGQLNIVGNWGDRDSHTAMSMADVAARVDALGGVAVAAHIDRAKIGFEMLASGYPNWKSDIISSSGLFGLEVDEANHLVWFSEHDEKTGEGGERLKLLNQRANSSATAGRVQLAHVQNSDAHTMADLVSHIEKRELTRFKLNELTFDALRTAFVDPQARVRATAVLPPAVPRILGMQVSGGFLDNQTYHFSDNLNCFIGGRGAGKSTAVKTIAYGLGVDDKLAEFDNCPDNVVLYAEDDGGVRFRYERNRGSEPLVRAKESNEISDVPVDAFRVEYIGQGELSKVAEDPLKRPDLLQEFLDRHIILSDLRANESELLASLSENTGQIIPLEASAAQLAAKREDLKKIDTKLEIAKTGKVKELAEFQIAVAAEKALYKSLNEVRTFYEKGLSLAAHLRDFGAMTKSSGQLTTDKDSVAGFQAASTAINGANTRLTEAQQNINASLKVSAQELKDALDHISQAHKGFDQVVTDRKVDLQKKGLSGGITELNTLIKQRTTLAEEITRIETQHPLLDQLRAERQRLLAGLKTVRTEVSTRRKAQVTAINSNLSSTIKDYTVVLYYEEKGDVTKFKGFLAETLKGTYFQDEIMVELCRSTTPEMLCTLIAARDAVAIAALANIGDGRAKQILERFQPLTVLYALEGMWKEPSPVIKVLTKGSVPKPIPVNQLSDGQKHTILLTIAMLAESNLPLIIDQPEDDLDNAFIFSSIVTTLRAIKEKRQVIVVTHNANIAVLGDSELILPMRRKGESGEAFDRGGIDKGDTRRAVQDILEGGPLAFRKRKELYGY